MVERVGSRRGETLADRVRAATVAFDRERYLEARSLLTPIAAEVPDVAEVRELLGLTMYRLGRWAAAQAELEAHRALTKSSEHLAVLADCARARRQWKAVDELWAEIRGASLSAPLLAEGRIVVAGAHADRGNLKAALAVMQPGEVVPKRPKEHHVKMWYVLGDLYDRSGAVSKAVEFFRRVDVVAPGYAGVAERLAALGR